jgi:hypothetical protein
MIRIGSVKVTEHIVWHRYGGKIVHKLDEVDKAAGVLVLQKG